PGAAVFIDGQATGRTTPAELALEPGQPHELRLELDGYTPVTQSLPAFTASLTREVKLEKRPVGSLRIETTPPGATVVLDGRRIDGTTPLVVSALASDVPHEGALSLEGYALDVADVTLAPERLTTFARKLVRTRAGRTTPSKTNDAPAVKVSRPGTLKVTTTPASITLYVDGRKVGETPAELSLPAGRHEL